MTCEPTDRLLQSLKVHAPGATDAMINLELFNVVDEFFRRTSAWRYENDIELQPETWEYDLNLPVNSVVVRSLAVSHNNTPVPSTQATVGITQSSLGRLNPELTFPDGDASFLPAVSDLNESSNLFTYAIYSPDYIQTTGQVTEEMQKYPLKLALALSVSQGCLECDCGDWAFPEWMWDMFFHDWYNGTLGNLYGMPAKPWSNPTLSSVHSKRYRDKMAFRKQESLRGFTWGVGGWKFPRGGGWV
jgi:hypothetical protein